MAEGVSPRAMTGPPMAGGPIMLTWSVVRRSQRGAEGVPSEVCPGQVHRAGYTTSHDTSYLGVMELVYRTSSRTLSSTPVLILTYLLVIWDLLTWRDGNRTSNRTG